MAEEGGTQPEIAARADFVPDCVYDKDAEFVELYRHYCLREGLQNALEDNQSSSESEDEDSGEDDPDGEDDVEGEDDRGFSRRVMQAPPLYDIEDHYHPDHDRDFRMLSFLSSGLRHIQMEAMMSTITQNPDSLSGTIRNETLAKVHLNRKQDDRVHRCMKSIVTLTARLAGIRGTAPTRTFQVPGNLPLPVLHDRVLCPLFGWTRGYHDYRFAIPPSGYPRG